MKGYIYKHTSPSGKGYIGQTYQEPQDRWKNGTGYNKNHRAIYAAIQKYGWENFTSEILEEVETDSIQELNRLEEKYIIAHNTLAPNGYNLKTHGENHIVSAETRKKMSESSTGKKLGEKALLSLKNRTISEETRQKMSMSRRGRPKSEETKRKLSESIKARVMTDTHREAIASANRDRCLGVPMSEPIRQRLIVSHTKLFGKPVIQMDISGNQIQIFMSIREASRQLNIDPSSIGKVCRQINKSCNGFVFRFLEGSQ
jgi:group I intron endonuclease